MRLLLILICATLCYAVVEATEPASEVVTPEADPVIEQPLADDSWRELFAKLAASKSRISQFEESRFFAFRKKPVVLTGTIRMVPGRGLSLSYSGAKPHVIIVDDQGVLMRDARGRQRAAPADSRGQAVTSALVDVLRFDVPALFKQFVVRGTRLGPVWRLGFVPRDPSVAARIRSIRLDGEALELRQIELVLSDEQRIEIQLRDSFEDVIFPPEVMERYFR